MKQIRIIKSKVNNYFYCITYKGRQRPQCKYPREVVTPRIRTYKVDYINHNEELVKYITYPKELLFTDVLPDDPIENEIIELKNMFPDWLMISIF